MNYLHMNYQKAFSIVAANSHLIGRLVKGGRIDELLIVPTNTAKREKFIAEYISNNCSMKDFEESGNIEVDILAIVDKQRILQTNFFSFIDIMKLDKSFNVILDV